MNYELRESLATAFADMMRLIREDKWKAFCEAAETESLDPYVALARILVREVEQQMSK